MPRLSLNNSNLKRRLSKTVADFYKRNKKHILDIILYGSTVRGKTYPQDTDIAIIFRKFDKKVFYDTVYNLRKALEPLDINADVKGMEMEDVFNKKLFT